MKPPPRPRPRRDRPGLPDADRDRFFAEPAEHAGADDIGREPELPRAAKSPREEAPSFAQTIAGDAEQLPSAPARRHGRESAIIPLRRRSEEGAPRVTLLDSVRHERASARARARRRYILGGTGAVLLVGLLVWAVFFSPLLALKSITIRNSGPKVSESAIQAVLDPFIGTPLPRLSTSDMQRAVESLTAVESVSVARSWPHSATVSVTGREAVAVEKLEDGQYQLLDAYGIALGVRSEIPEGVPVLDLSGPEHLREPQVDDVLTVLGALPGDVRERLTTAQVDADGLMSFTLENGARVVWGSATDTELKARVLEVLLSQEAKVYDVSAPRTPVTR